MRPARLGARSVFDPGLEWPDRKLLMGKLIAANPQEALTKAANALDGAAALLLMLINSKKLIAPYSFDPCGGNEAVDCLCSRISWLMEELGKLVPTGGSSVVFTAWHGSVLLSEKIHDLALMGPIDNLKLIARDSLFMPSLRAKAEVFTYDFREIADRLDLSRACCINLDFKARHRLDSMATRYVAKLVEFIEARRSAVQWSVETLSRFQALAKTGRPLNCTIPIEPGRLAAIRAKWGEYGSMSLETYLRRNRIFRAQDIPELLIWHRLPPFHRDSVETWWNKAIKPHLEKSATLGQLRCTPFYRQLEQATGSGKNYEIIGELKRRCHQALRARSLSKPAPAPPAGMV